MLGKVTENKDKAYIMELFPQPRPCRHMDYMLQMLYRQKLMDKMRKLIIEFIQIKIYMIQFGQRHEMTFTPYRDRLKKCLHRPAWTVCHFMERYRHMILHMHPHHEDPTASATECSQCIEVTDQLVRSYPREETVPAYQFYQLAQLHLRDATRAPTFAGSFERKLRGWSRKAPTEEELARFLVLGGIPQISKVGMMHGSYNSRLGVLGDYVDKLDHATTTFRLAFGDIDVQIVEPHTNKDITQELETTFDLVDINVLKSLPKLEDYFLSAWSKRIMEEGLIEHERDLVSPFGFIQSIMAAHDAERMGL